MSLGVAEDTVKQPDPVVAQVRMRLLRLAGFSVGADHLAVAAR